MAHLYWCEHWKWECRQQKLNSPVIIKPCGLGFLPKFIQIRKEERHVWTRHFEDTVMHLPRKFTLSVFEVLAFDLYQIYIYIYIYYIYICIYTYLPCMSACFGLVCISHQFFRWSQGLFGVRTAVLAASSEVHPDVCYRGMVRRWAYHIKTECETGSNHGKGAITAKKKNYSSKIPSETGILVWKISLSLWPINSLAPPFARRSSIFRSHSSLTATADWPIKTTWLDGLMVF